MSQAVIMKLFRIFIWNIVKKINAGMKISFSDFRLKIRLFICEFSTLDLAYAGRECKQSFFSIWKKKQTTSLHYAFWFVWYRWGFQDSFFFFHKQNVLFQLKPNGEVKLTKSVAVERLTDYTLFGHMKKL